MGGRASRVGSSLSIGCLVASVMPNHVRLWNTDDSTANESKRYRELAFDYDAIPDTDLTHVCHIQGPYIAIGSTSDQIYVYDILRGLPTHTLVRKNSMDSNLVYSPSQSLLIAASCYSSRGRLHFFAFEDHADLSQITKRKKLETERGPVYSLGFNEHTDPNLIVTGHRNGLGGLYDVTTASEIGSLEFEAEGKLPSIIEIAISSNGDQILTGTNEGHLRLSDRTSLSLIRDIKPFEHGISGCFWSQSHPHTFIVGSNQDIAVYDCRNMTSASATWDCGTYGLTMVEIDDRRFGIVGGGGGMKVFLRNGKCVHEAPIGGGGTGLAFIPPQTFEE